MKVSRKHLLSFHFTFSDQITLSAVLSNYNLNNLWREITQSETVLQANAFKQFLKCHFKADLVTSDSLCQTLA